jgi:predicted  nucleic acid-binding Zn-ribbon protein
MIGALTGSTGIFSSLFGGIAGSAQQAFAGAVFAPGVGGFSTTAPGAAAAGGSSLLAGLLGGAGAGAGGLALGQLGRQLFESQAAASAFGGLSGAAQGALIGSIVPGIGTLVGGIIGGLSGIISSFFGGPSSAEKAGRAQVSEFEQFLQRSLSGQQAAEAAGESWRATVIAVRDAYLAVGRSEQEALRDVERLWASSRDGGEEAGAVIDEIRRKMEEMVAGTSDASAAIGDAAGAAADHVARSADAVRSAVDAARANVADLEAALQAATDPAQVRNLEIALQAANEELARATREADALARDRKMHISVTGVDEAQQELGRIRPPSDLAVPVGFDIEPIPEFETEPVGVPIEADVASAQRDLEGLFESVPTEISIPIDFGAEPVPEFVAPEPLAVPVEVDIERVQKILDSLQGLAPKFSAEVDVDTSALDQLRPQEVMLHVEAELGAAEAALAELENPLATTLYVTSEVEDPTLPLLPDLPLNIVADVDAAVLAATASLEQIPTETTYTIHVETTGSDEIAADVEAAGASLLAASDAHLSDIGQASRTEIEEAIAVVDIFEARLTEASDPEQVAVLQIALANARAELGTLTSSTEAFAEKTGDASDEIVDLTDEVGELGHADMSIRLLQRAIDGLQREFGDAERAAEGLIGTLESIPTEATFTMNIETVGDELPAAAEGGVTRGPTIAGEAGPEAIIPLDRFDFFTGQDLASRLDLLNRNFQTFAATQPGLVSRAVRDLVRGAG